MVIWPQHFLIPVANSARAEKFGRAEELLNETRGNVKYVFRKYIIMLNSLTNQPFATQ